MPVDHFSKTLHRWAYDYYNSVLYLNEKHGGISMFPVKYNNACLALELIVKSHYAYNNRHLDDKTLLRELKNRFGHSLAELIVYIEDGIGVHFTQEQKDNLLYVDGFYSNHYFRYPPRDFTSVALDHQVLLAAINDLRLITANLLVACHEQTNGYYVD